MFDRSHVLAACRATTDVIFSTLHLCSNIPVIAWNTRFRYVCGLPVEACVFGCSMFWHRNVLSFTRSHLKGYWRLDELMPQSYMVARSVAHALWLSYMLSMIWVVSFNCLHFRALFLRMLWCLVVVICGLHLRTHTLLREVFSGCICMDWLHGGFCSTLVRVEFAAIVFP